MFKRIALLKGHQKIEPPNHSYSSDLTELCHLAAFIREDVSLVTIPVSPYDKKPFKTFIRNLKRHGFDLVGISCMSSGYNSGREYARLAREAGAFVVMGGYHPTALTDEVLSDPNVDAVIRGEGERVLRDLVLRGPGEDIPGLSFKRGGEIVHNPDQDLIADLDTLPQPMRSIRPARFGERGDRYSIDTVYSSRGCIARCTFCANDTVNKSFRPRSPEHFVEELMRIHDPNQKKIVKFWDSIFLFDPARVEKIVDLMLRRNLTHFRIITESRSDDVIRCEHLMPELRRVGFEKIQIGIESPDPETFRRLRKGGSVAKHERAVRIIQQGGMKVEGFFIIGHSHETEEDIKRYPDFSERLGIHHRALYFVMTPYPGTQVFREYQEKNLIESRDWDNYNNYGTVVHSDRLTRHQISNLLSHCYGRTFGVPFAFKKVSTVPRMAGLILSFTVVWQYLFDLQGSPDPVLRNRFVASLFEPGLGSYRKKRKSTFLSRLFGWWIRKVEFRITLSESEAFLFTFRMQPGELRLDVAAAGGKGRKLMNVNLEDIDIARSSLDMVDLNAFMILSQKKKGLVKGILFSLPAVFGAGRVLLRLFVRSLVRYFAPTRARPLGQADSVGGMFPRVDTGRPRQECTRP